MDAKEFFEEGKHIRISDRILFALDLALAQDDLAIAEELVKALDISMTRNSGGEDFVERRDYPEQIEDMMDRLDALRARKK